MRFSVSAKLPYNLKTSKPYNLIKNLIKNLIQAEVVEPQPQQLGTHIWLILRMRPGIAAKAVNDKLEIGLALLGISFRIGDATLSHEITV